MIVQIYEIQQPAEAQALIDLGVDHIGSVLLSETDWRDPVLRETLLLIEHASARSSLIPLFSDQETILRALDYYQPDILHFCEMLDPCNGSLDRCVALQADVKRRFPQVRIMRSLPIPRPGCPPLAAIREMVVRFEPVSDYFLTDTLITGDPRRMRELQPVNGYVGITGQTCDWAMAAELVQASRVPVILAGGISADNVREGIDLVRPAGVDSCSLTNSRDPEGRPLRFKKDLDHVKRLVAHVRATEKSFT